MDLRPMTEQDLPELVHVLRAFEQSWFGEPETAEDEGAEWLEQADRACVLLDGGRVVGAARTHSTGSDVVADPAADPPRAYSALFGWLAEQGAHETEVLDRDAALVAVLQGAGWSHARSSFELIRAVAGWERAEPAWPEGVARGTGAEPRAVHHLFYDEARWADVEGHPDRPFDDWQRIFRTEIAGPPGPVLAFRGERLVGAALLRLFGDGTGWVTQLAVAADERRHGLGRALLLTSLAELADAGADKLGLTVQGANRKALDLYLQVGLTVDREWQTYTAP